MEPLGLLRFAASRCIELIVREATNKRRAISTATKQVT